MAKIKLYAIHDNAIKGFIGPDVSRTHAEAERKFRHNVNDSKMGFLHTNPQNFSLHYIGEFDDEKGILLPKAEPEFIMSAIQAKEINETGGKETN